MEQFERGIFKREVGKLEIKDYETSRAVIYALIDRGFELTSAPITNSGQVVVGEVITIYKKEIVSSNK